MKELGPAAREFVESHGRNRSLTDATRARIKQKLMLRVSTVGATTAVAGTAAGMSLASKVVLVVLGVTGAVGTGSLSVWALRARAPSRVTPTETSVRTARDVAPAAPAPDPELAPPPMAAVAARDRAPPLRPMALPARAAAPHARAQMRGPATTPAAAPASTPAQRPPTAPMVAAATASSGAVDSGRPDQLTKINDRPVVSAPENPTRAAILVEAPDPEPELRTVREARADLRAGRPANAYRRLEDFNRQSPGGMLVQERSALSAIALCQAQPGRDAQERATEFLRRSPESPLATRVKSACEPALKGSW